MTRFRELAGLALVFFSTFATTVIAQAADPRWEIDVHAGGAFPTVQAHGTTALPPPNDSLFTPIPDAARIVSSWYFGDGTAQFNAATALQPFFSGQLVPLDPVLRARFGEPQAGVSGGVRVSRMLTSRVSAEFSFDAANNPLQLTAASVSGIEVTSLSYEYAFNGLFVLPTARTLTVTSRAHVEDDRGRRFTTVGALIVNVARSGRLTPYVAIGAGAVTHHGGTPSAELSGAYAFTIPPPSASVPPGQPTVTVSDGDVVRVRTIVSNQLALALGGGFKYATGSRMGVRVDVRDYVAGDSQKTVLDAMPTRIPSASSIIIGSGPRLTFGASTIRQTLSAPSISNFETYSATGTEHDVHLTAGIYWKF